MNDNDIIKALECCMQNVLGCCDSCPMIDKEPMEWDECQRDIMGKALGLIYRQKSKIEAQEMDIAQLHSDIINAICHADNAVLQLKYERALAIKEFAERIEPELANNTDISAVGYQSVIAIIDGLVKEMTEGER